jgi:hypothetical protein
LDVARVSSIPFRESSQHPHRTTTGRHSVKIHRRTLYMSESGPFLQEMRPSTRFRKCRDFGLVLQIFKNLKIRT